MSVPTGWNLRIQPAPLLELGVQELRCAFHAVGVRVHDVARKAELFGAKVAKSLNASVTVLAMVENDQNQAEAEHSAERTSRFLKRGGIDHDIRIRVGPIDKTIVQEAGDDHIIVLGVSTRSELTKFIMGSRPIKIIQQASTPVLLVK